MTVTPLSNLLPAGTAQAPTQPKLTAEADTNVRFEQLLWAELLTHTGLEKALTLGGGEGASMFSRYFVEAIAADIAEQHPLGLLDKQGATSPSSEAEPESDS